LRKRWKMIGTIWIVKIELTVPTDFHSLIKGLGAAVISMGYPKVHKAKGQECARVYINPEGAASFSIPGGASVNQFGDESNVAYMAFTRTM